MSMVYFFDIMMMRCMFLSLHVRPKLISLMLCLMLMLLGASVLYRSVRFSIAPTINYLNR